MNNSLYFVTLLLGGFILFVAHGAPTADQQSTTQSVSCASNNGSCDACVKNAKCLYCFIDSKCMDYPSNQLIPKVKNCDLGKLRWGTCFVNYKALLIAMGTIAGLLLLSCSGCIVYCCWCRGPSGRQRRKWAKDDAKDERKKAERQMKQDQRKAERQAKNDEIRRKYGLKHDDDSQYHQLDED